MLLRLSKDGHARLASASDSDPTPVPSPCTLSRGERGIVSSPERDFRLPLRRRGRDDHDCVQGGASTAPTVSSAKSADAGSPSPGRERVQGVPFGERHDASALCRATSPSAPTTLRIPPPQTTAARGHHQVSMYAFFLPLRGCTGGSALIPATIQRRDSAGSITSSMPKKVPAYIAFAFS